MLFLFVFLQHQQQTPINLRYVGMYIPQISRKSNYLAAISAKDEPFLKQNHHVQ